MVVRVAPPLQEDLEMLAEPEPEPEVEVRDADHVDHLAAQVLSA